MTVRPRASTTVVAAARSRSISSFVPVALINGIIYAGDVSIFGAIIVAAVATIATYWFQGMVVEAARDILDGRRDHTIGSLIQSVTPVIAPLLIAGILPGLGIGHGGPEGLLHLVGDRGADPTSALPGQGRRLPGERADQLRPLRAQLPHLVTGQVLLRLPQQPTQLDQALDLGTLDIAQESGHALA